MDGGAEDGGAEDGGAEDGLVAVAADEVVRMLGIVASVFVLAVVVVVVVVVFVVVVVTGAAGALKTSCHSSPKADITSLDNCSAISGSTSVGTPISLSAGLCRTSKSRLASL